jgi:hypothetical protein
MDGVPLDLKYYTYDRIHFNENGKKFYAQKLFDFLHQSNFQDRRRSQVD